jgi:precorrin-2 methylase
MDCIVYEGKEYLVLMPVDEEDDEIVILEVEPVDEENENYLAVDDEAVLMAVYEIFKEKFKDVLNFAD